MAQVITIKRIKGILLTVGILSLGAVILIFMNLRRQVPSDQAVTSVNTNATIALVDVRYTAITDGEEDWSLEAESADILLAEKHAVLKGLRITFSDTDGAHVFLEAESGVWQTDSNDLEVSDNVMIKSRQYVLQTEKLSYSRAERMIVSRTPVTIESASLTGRADILKYDLNTGLIYLNETDTGKIGKNFEP